MLEYVWLNVLWLLVVLFVLIFWCIKLLVCKFVSNKLLWLLLKLFVLNLSVKVLLVVGVFFILKLKL